MRLFLIAAACFSALASSAVAQSEPPVSTPEQRQAQAEQMISASSSGEFFVYEENPPAVTIRHPRSGLLCRFGYGVTGQEVAIVPSESFGIPRGDDVACGVRNQLGALSLYATRRSDIQNADQALAEAVRAIQTMNPSARPVRLSLTDSVELPDRPLPEGSRTATFTMSANGQQLYTRVSVYVRDGWTYKLRFTAPNQRANIMADMTWAAALTDLPPLAESAN